MIGRWLKDGEVPVESMPAEQRRGWVLMGNQYLKPDEASAAAPKGPPRYTLAMPKTAPAIAPHLIYALSPLLAERDKNGAVVMSEVLGDIDPRTNKPAVTKEPMFAPGPSAFVDQACEGVQIIVESILHSRVGNPAEILGHLESKLKPIAAEHLDKKVQGPAVFVVLAFLRGAFVLLSLV